MAKKDYVNPLEARVTKPERPTPTLPKREGEDGAVATAAPSGELADKLRALIKTKWDEVSVKKEDYLDHTKPFEPIDWAISINDEPVFAFDDYNYIQGQSGNGKTLLMSILEAVILGAKFGNVKYIGNRANPTILHVDTEQSTGSVQLHKVRVFEMVGWEQGSDHSDRYQILPLRKVARPEDRWARVIRACYDLKPDFVFLDGMLDVVVGMNKEEECNLVISEAETFIEEMKLCFLGICHENPDNSKKDEGPAKPAGHIGSFSQRKGAAGVGVKKTLNLLDPSFAVTPKKVRNGEYLGFSFGIKKVPIILDGKEYNIAIPCWVDSSNPTGGGDDTDDKANRKKDEIKKAVLSIQWKSEGLRYKDIEAGLKAYGITSNRMISDYIILSQEEQFIEKRGNLYFLMIDSENIDTQQGMKVDESDEEPF